MHERRPGAARCRGGDLLSTLVAKYAGRGDLTSTTTIDELGLSSLERVELMVALEDAFGTRIDEHAFAEARDLSALRTVVEQGDRPARQPSSRSSFRRGTDRGRHAPSAARACRPGSCRSRALFAWIRVDGRENLEADPGSGDLRRESPEPHGHAGHPGGAARPAPLPRRPGDGQGVLQGALLSGRALAARLVHQLA